MQHLEQILLTSSFIVPLILSITILIESKGSLPKRIMGLALFNAFFVFLANYFYFRHLMNTYIIIHSLHIASVLWLYPSIYLYVNSIIADEKVFKKKVIHLLPGLVFGIGSAILFYGLLDQNERIYYLSNYRGEIEFSSVRMKLVYIFRMVDVVLIAVQVVYYTIVMIRLPYKYHERLKEEYSNIENFSIEWIKWFNVSFVVVGFLSILFYVFNPLDAKNDLFLVFFLFVISVFMWIVGIWAFKQKKPQIIDQINTSVQQNGNANLITNEDALAKALLDYFDKDEPYLDPGLNLTLVCKNIGTNRTYLSVLINNRFGVNFNTFVNQYRVKYVNNYSMAHPQTSNEKLATIGGFGSVSSLKRALSKSN